MSYPEAAWERAMTVQEVLLKAIGGELHGFRAAEILGWSPRTVRRWRERYEPHGYSGLIDKRLLRPSGRRVPPRLDHRNRRGRPGHHGRPGHRSRVAAANATMMKTTCVSPP